MCFLISEGGLKVHNLLSTELVWGNSFRVMFMGKRPLNMTVCGVGGVLMRFMGLIGWGYGRIIGAGGVF